MNVSELAEAVMAGERRALSRAITLAESTRADHGAQTSELLDHLRGSGRRALRIGLSGTPGVGKSSFIEAFGVMLTGLGKRVAVLAVDPSSTRSGGSILGDKTRMERLSRDPLAFIRPSPSQSALGGVARRTREAADICEAAGFDVILIETVGVGQSETMVAEMTDLFVLLLAPAGGDELQGVKRGIMEIADLILINKADGDLRDAAMRTAADYAGALSLMRRRGEDPEGFPKVAQVSALQETGLAEAWGDMEHLAAWRRENGHFEARRARQAQLWFQRELETGILEQLLSDPEVTAQKAAAEAALNNGATSPRAAAQRILAGLRPGSQS